MAQMLVSTLLLEQRMVQLSFTHANQSSYQFHGGAAPRAILEHQNNLRFCVPAHLSAFSHRRALFQRPGDVFSFVTTALLVTIPPKVPEISSPTTFASIFFVLQFLKSQASSPVKASAADLVLLYSALYGY